MDYEYEEQDTNALLKLRIQEIGTDSSINVVMPALGGYNKSTGKSIKEI